MFTGISGSYTVWMASRIAGFNASVRAASATSAAVSFEVGAGWAGRSGTIGRDFILRLFGRGDRVALERGFQGMPGQARALHAHRELAHAGQRRQLAHVLH